MEHKKSYYQTDFPVIFHNINKCIEALDELGICQLIGEQPCKAFADAFVQLVMRTWEVCPPDNVFDRNNQLQ